MPDMQGIEHVIEAAQAAVEPSSLGDGEGRFFTVRESGDVKVRVIDLDEVRACSDTAAHPVRKLGTATVRDAASFVAYVRKHGDPNTEVWADETARTVTAVLNAHQEGPDGPAGWGDHRVELSLETTPAWKKWTRHDGQMLTQTEFAELIEERSIDFNSSGGHPTAADMLELAQTFKATSTSQFESSKRLKTGETQLVYIEDTSAAAGTRGDLAIPDVFRLVLQPFVGGPPHAVYCRLRYRIERGTQALRLGFVMERPDDVLSAAFGQYVDEIRGEDAEVDPDGGISQPVWWGSPIR